MSMRRLVRIGCWLLCCWQGVCIVQDPHPLTQTIPGRPFVSTSNHHALYNHHLLAGTPHFRPSQDSQPPSLLSPNLPLPSHTHTQISTTLAAGGFSQGFVQAAARDQVAWEQPAAQQWSTKTLAASKITNQQSLVEVRWRGRTRLAVCSCGWAFGHTLPPSCVCRRCRR